MRIVVACQARELSLKMEGVLRGLGEVNVASVSRDVIEKSSSPVQADLLLIGVAGDQVTDLSWVEEVVRRSACESVAVIGPATNPKFILQVLKSGITRYVDEAEICSDLKSVLQEASRSPEVGGAGDGRLMVVVGLTGGCGSSTIALNCAVENAATLGNTALIDLDLRKGDLAPMLNLAPAHTIVEFCRNLSRMDNIMFGQCFAAHATGVQLMAAPTRYRDITQITGEGVQALLTLSRRRFPAVWVDLRQYFQVESIPVLRNADQIVCVLRQDFTSLQQAARFMGFLDDQDISANKVSFVVGRSGQSNAVPVRDIESALRTKLLASIPDDAYSANEATNRGQPVLVTRPRSALSKAIKGLTKALAARVPGQG